MKSYAGPRAQLFIEYCNKGRYDASARAEELDALARRKRPLFYRSSRDRTNNQEERGCGGLLSLLFVESVRGYDPKTDPLLLRHRVPKEEKKTYITIKKIHRSGSHRPKAKRIKAEKPWKCRECKASVCLSGRLQIRTKKAAYDCCKKCDDALVEIFEQQTRETVRERLVPSRLQGKSPQFCIACSRQLVYDSGAKMRFPDPSGTLWPLCWKDYEYNLRLFYEARFGGKT